MPRSPETGFRSPMRQSPETGFRSPEKHYYDMHRDRSPHGDQIRDRAYSRSPPGDRIRDRAYMSASPACGRRRAGSREPKDLEPRDSPFGSVLRPLGAVRPQLFAAPHALVATTGGRVMCLCGGVIVESGMGGRQAVLCGPRPRKLGCCALSPCGRYVGAGEAPNVRGPLVLVFDRVNGGPPIALRGHQRGIQIVAWSPYGAYLVSLGDMDSGHQIILWSWPGGERLASTLSGRIVADLAFAPDADIFTTVGGSIVRRWTVSQPQDAFVEIRSKGPPELIGVSTPLEAPGLPRARDRGDDGSASCVACGVQGSCYVAVRRGILCALRGDHVDVWIDLGVPANALKWTETVCGTTCQEGLVLAALATGAVLVIDASSLQVITSVGDQGPDCPAVGLSCGPDETALWVLYGDCSLARWQSLEGDPSKGLLAPFPQLRDARSVPAFGENGEPQVITSTDRGLQLWHLSSAGLACEQTEDLCFAGGEVCALACSSSVAASGHRGGDIRLFDVPGLECLGPLPARHASDVLSLCFSPEVEGGLLHLASASRDRTVMIFLIDLGKLDFASLILTIPGHSAAITHVGLALGVDHFEAPREGLMSANRTVHLAACTADKSLVVREIALGSNGSQAMVRRSNQQPSRGKAWVGLCVDQSRPIMYAACADRRVLQLGPLGQPAQQVRLGNADCELSAPLRLSMDGRLLAVGLTGTDMGVGLMETIPVLRTVARLVGHAEPSQGIAFLGSTLLSCSSDGAMLLWRSPTSEELEARNLKTARPPKPPQNADGILRRLLASSPKPPRWASTRDIRSFAEKVESDNGSWTVPHRAHANNGVWDIEGEEQSQSYEHDYMLGKWGRISKVGAQVRSASDLHQLVREDASICSNIKAEAATKPRACLELPIINSDSSTETDVQTVEAVVKDSSAETISLAEAVAKDFEQSILELPVLPEEEESTDAESAGPATQSSNPGTGSNSENEAVGNCTDSAPTSCGNLGLQPLRRLLPPVPNFPIPGVQKNKVLSVSKELRPIPKPVGENGLPEGTGDCNMLCSADVASRRESAASKSSTCSVADPNSRARSLFKDLSQEPAAVLTELTCLLQEKMEPAEEPSPLPPHCDSVKKLRGAAKKLCKDVENGLQPGPLSDEVLPLLRRVHGLLHHNQVHLAIASLTGTAA